MIFLLPEEVPKNFPALGAGFINSTSSFKRAREKRHFYMLYKIKKYSSELMHRRGQRCAK